MKSRFTTPLALACLMLRAPSLFAATCECADMADLLNRDAEGRAAILAYQNALSQWGNAAPKPNETNRAQLQQTVQQALDQVTTSGTNKAIGVTDGLCQTTIRETSVCMLEVAAQHEHVHASACISYRSAHSSPLDTVRYSTLADYAKEEIAAYQAEGAFVHGNLANMQSECDLKVELQSTITGTFEMAQSHATATIDAAIQAPYHQPAVSYRGTGSLNYQTENTGPPKKVGDALLTQLMATCYVTYVGAGTTSFDIIDGKLRRNTAPPFDARLELVLAVGRTDKKAKTDG